MIGVICQLLPSVTGSQWFSPDAAHRFFLSMAWVLWQLWQGFLVTCPPVGLV